jgi:hypothetical protein
MIIAALVRLFKKIVPNTKMSKAAKAVPVVKKYYYEKATFIKFSDNLITFSYTYNNITAKVEHTLTREQVNTFVYKIYSKHFDTSTNKLKTGQIFAAIGKTSGEIEYLFWESKKKGKDGKKEKIRF